MKPLPEGMEFYKGSEKGLMGTAKILTQEIVGWCQDLNYYPVIEVEGRTYRVQTYTANLGDADYFSVDVGRDDWRIIPAEQAHFGVKTYLYSDFSCPVRHMSRATWRQLVRDLPAIYTRFDEIISSGNTENIEWFFRLRRMVEAGNRVIEEE